MIKIISLLLVPFAMFSVPLIVLSLYWILPNIWVRFFKWFRFWNTQYEEIEKYVPKKGIIHDIGAGYGIFSDYLIEMSPERQVLAVEPDEQKIKHCKKAYKFTSSTQIAPTFKPDCCVLLDVLHHLRNYEEQFNLLDGCVKILKPGGTIVLKEIHDSPKWKFLLTQCVDNILYFGDNFYFRSIYEWESILKGFGLKTKVVQLDKGRFFTHWMVVGTKV